MKLFMVGLVLLSGNWAAPCADFCAVRIFVIGANGSPAPALVELRNSNGDVVDHSSAAKGVAEFCDFDFGVYSIAIGGSACGAVVIPGLRLRYGVTQEYKAYLNRCGGFETLPQGCSVYFRVTDEANKPLGGAVVASTAIGGRAITADSYGRARIWLSPGSTEKVEFTKQGYSSTSYQYECVKPGNDEKKIALSPLPK